MRMAMLMLMVMMRSWIWMLVDGLANVKHDVTHCIDDGKDKLMF
jgi:hypothetical protein